MPLHLLGKKSWNVYNKDNIARVRRDEAEAQAREDELDRRTQAADAEKRIQLLRGRTLNGPPANEVGQPTGGSKHDHNRSRKRRRLVGEDDTDRDIRLAQDEVVKQPQSSKVLRNHQEPLADVKGHINLFPEVSKNGGKNPEVEAERALRKREYEDQYTMRFSNAAGNKQTLDAPWYSTLSRVNENVTGKNAWGDEDAGRNERDKTRTNASDPLAMMKRGVKQLQDTERGREHWLKEREDELQELKWLQRSARHEHKKKRRDPLKNESDRPEDLIWGESTADRPRDTSRHKHRSHQHSSHRHRRRLSESRREVGE